MDTEQIERLYVSLADCGDQMAEFSERLCKGGFAAFVARRAFRESFCSSDEERDNHRRYLIEVAKVRLARPAPTQWWDDKSFYCSAHNEELLRLRDEANGCSSQETRTRYPNEVWRRELDPCQRKLMQARMQDSEFATRWEAVRRNESLALASEAQTHATETTEPSSFDSQARYARFASVMNREGGQFGFSQDKAKSKRDFPVYSRPMANDLDLCWVIEERENFAFRYAEGDYRPSLQLRESTFGGSAKRAAAGQLSILDYQAAMPDFAEAYCTFRNLDELETVIKAHLTLYSFVAPFIDTAVRRALQS